MRNLRSIGTGKSIQFGGDGASSPIMAHSNDKRLRGRKLQDRRSRWFSAYPLCVHCEKRGRVTLATELDHVTPLSRQGKDDESNLQGLCSPCHEAKTEQDMGYRHRPIIGDDGYPVGG